MDAWAIGVIAFELLTGRSAFKMVRGKQDVRPLPFTPVQNAASCRLIMKHVSGFRKLIIPVPCAPTQSQPRQCLLESRAHRGAGRHACLGLDRRLNLCVMLMLGAEMQVIDQLVGNRELPWEGSRLTSSVLRKLGAHKKDVLGLLRRDPEERLTLYQFLNSCSRVLAATESQVPHTQVGASAGSVP